MIKNIFCFLLFISVFSCDNKKDHMAVKIVLERESSELVIFEYIPDTGNKTSLLKYEIKFNTPIVL